MGQTYQVLSLLTGDLDWVFELGLLLGIYPPLCGALLLHPVPLLPSCIFRDENRQFVLSNHIEEYLNGDHRLQLADPSWPSFPSIVLKVR